MPSFKKTVLHTALLSTFIFAHPSFAFESTCQAHFDGTQLHVPCIQVEGLASQFSASFAVTALQPHLKLQMAAIETRFAETPSQQLRGIFQRQGYGEIIAIADTGFHRYDYNQYSCTRVEHNVPLSELSAEQPSVLMAADSSYFETLAQYQAGDSHPYTYQRLPTLPTTCAQASDAPISDFRTNFEALWHSFNDNYPFFAIKDVDWQAVYTQAQTQLNNVASDEDLLALFAEMLHPLDDIHVEIEIDGDVVVASQHILPQWLLMALDNYRAEQTLPNLQQAFEAQDEIEDFEAFVMLLLQNDAGHQQFMEQFTTQAEQIIPSYVSDIECAVPSVCYGNLNQDIAYLNLQAMSDYTDADDVEQDMAFMQGFLSELIPELADKQALVIDVRNNDGGNDSVSLLIAEHFTAQRQLAYRKKAKFADGFANQHAIYLQPAEQTFTKPVYVLINEDTFSAGEIFALAMKGLPNVTLVGEATRGGLSDQIERTLPNGWSFSVPSEVYSDAKGNEYEEVGVPPALVAPYWQPANVQQGKDAAIESVLTHFQAQ